MPSTICDMCAKKGARVHRVTRCYGEGEEEFLIRGVPVVICPHCGEKYLTAETLREIERIKLHRHQWAVKRPFPVAEFAGTR
jgi:YgiT-type zinc finger domain-containing protein